jgi:hypothetical protein
MLARRHLEARPFFVVSWPRLTHPQSVKNLLFVEASQNLPRRNEVGFIIKTKTNLHMPVLSDDKAVK